MASPCPRCRLLAWAGPWAWSRGCRVPVRGRPGNCGPLPASVASADCGLSRPWFPRVTDGRVWQGSPGQRGTREALPAPPKGGLGYRHRVLGVGSRQRVHVGGLLLPGHQANQACPTAALAPTWGHLLASRPLSCLCPGLLPCSPGQPVPAGGLSVPACCPRADRQPWLPAWGALFPVALGQGC